MVLIGFSGVGRVIGNGLVIYLDIRCVLIDLLIVIVLIIILVTARVIVLVTILAIFLGIYRITVGVV